MLWVAVCCEWTSPLVRAVPKLSLSLPFSPSRAALAHLRAPLGTDPEAPAARAGQRLPARMALANLDLPRGQALPPVTHPLSRTRVCFAQETVRGDVAGP